MAAREECLCILVNNAAVSSETVQPESGSADEMRRNLFDTTKTTAADWLAGRVRDRRRSRPSSPPPPPSCRCCGAPPSGTRTGPA
ncbi:hypothetical protein MYCTH_110038, partial [Thermothelomyces thermophilus ATCC 42464]